MIGKILWLLAALLLLHVQLAEAQQPKKVPRIGWLAFGRSRADRRQPFIEGLRSLGWVEGENIIIERRYANENYTQLPELAAELVRLKVDVIVVRDSVAIRPAAQSTKTIPIVAVVSGDPVADGLIDSLARPGGNVTGLTNISPQLAGKRLELLKEVVPRASNVTVLGPGANSDQLRSAAQSLGVRLQELHVQKSDQFVNVFEVAMKGGSNAVIVQPSALANYHRNEIVRLAAKHRLPAVYGVNWYVTSGGLMSYGPSITGLNHRAAYYVDKILKGAKPAHLPVEQPIRFELFINLKAAKQIDLTIPPNVLARADNVIK
ncbi:MAG TPA: ABC transporter substrate-binding protein [Candidatus Binatia bacterium]|nr:ABC transporter substrate-binding protein [Pyrinomonadaceae bacterium]